MTNYQYDAFISYVRGGASGQFAEDLCDRLRGTSNMTGGPARIFMDIDLDGGQTFEQRLQTALDESRHFLAVITEDYFSRKFCRWEFQQAWLRDPSSEGGFIIPFLLESSADKQIPKAFRSIQRVSTNVKRVDWFGSICSSLQLIDPSRPLEIYSRKSIQPLPVPKGRLRTPEGFVIVQGVEFAPLPQPNKGLWLSRTPITVGEYFRVLGPENMPPPPRFNHSWSYRDHPVVQVNWDEAIAFCSAIGGRLPTFAEWQSASGTSLPSVPTQDPGYTQSTDIDAKTDWTGLRSDREPTATGFYDLFDNVWEWCFDKGKAPNDRFICGMQSTTAPQVLSRSRRGQSLGFRCLIEEDSV